MENCKECGAILVGRTDKKFCSDGCRNDYHNRISRDENKEIRKINCILAKNRNVLKALFESKICECSKEKLYKMGFNFSYFTSYGRKPNVGKCYFCYDFGYFCSQKGHIFITQLN